MAESSRDDIRQLLKSFGVKADEAIIAHLARNPGDKPLKIKLILEDTTDYGGASPSESLNLEVEGEIRR
ncbi:MAG: hypothetical protein ACYTG7_17580 [Planctomycetota bacterium]|jgi:hypothetical protein